MSHSTNKKIGNDFETEFCELLFNKGFWCHNMAQNSAGQPADVIAVRNGKAYLIDCKVCSNDRFTFDRMECNQITSMRLWKDSGNEEGWFALKLEDGRVYMLHFSLMIALSLNQSSIGEDRITRNGLPLDRWLAKCK